MQFYSISSSASSSEKILTEFFPDKQAQENSLGTMDNLKFKKVQANITLLWG